jgi:hypothetical protein
MDVMSRSRLFRSSWFTTSASNGWACPAIGRRDPAVARSGHGTATFRAKRSSRFGREAGALHESGPFRPASFPALLFTTSFQAWRDRSVGWASPRRDSTHGRITEHRPCPRSLGRRLLLEQRNRSPAGRRLQSHRPTASGDLACG